jgi:HD-GYP domain-containing protein (c-di-GMP phosphodiesterase class II)
VVVSVKLLHVEKLKRGMVVGQELPAYEAGGVPLIRAGVTLTDELISVINRHEVRYLVIDDVATRIRQKLQDSTPRLIPVIKPTPIITPEIRENAISGLRDLFHDIEIGAEDLHASSLVVQQLDKVVGELVDVLTKDERAIININDLKSYDEYTYHHSLSVAVLSIAIGQHLRLDRRDLNRLGMSAIMHDIGKTSVPVDIINKASRLTNEEFSLVKTHSPEGYQYLLQGTIGNEATREGVLYHHEKIDGTGYPYGLSGEHIPVWSRIIAVADVYDALTSNRPYRLPMQPAEALEYIMGGIGSSFDYDVVSSFAQKVELYPVGSYVMLSNGASAVVLSTTVPMRPIVRVLKTGEVIDLSTERQYLNVVVVSLIADPVRALL